jgi:hypothetical protein
MLQLAKRWEKLKRKLINSAIFYSVHGFGKLIGPVSSGPDRLLCSEIRGTAES